MRTRFTLKGRTTKGLAWKTRSSSASLQRSTRFRSIVSTLRISPRSSDPKHSFRDSSSSSWGQRRGDRRTVEVTIPSNHSDKKIAGKQALFDCEISAVSCPQTREIDQELAGLIGFASLDEMKESVRENLKVDSEVIAEQIAKARLLEELVQRLDFELPPIVLKDEVDRIRQALEQPQAGEQPEEPTGDDEDQNARGVGQENGETGNPTGNEANPEQVAGGEESPDSPGDPDGNSRESDDELHWIATRRLRTAFLFTQIAKEQGISVSEGDMYKEYCTNYRPVALKVWKDQMMPNQQWRDTWYGVCLEKKVADWVLTQVNVTEKKCEPRRNRGYVAGARVMKFSAGLP